MSEAIRIRATLQGDITDIRILTPHPMETGLRRDAASGRTVPAHFIQTITITANGKPLIEAQLNTSVSKNPVFAFKARGLRAGDTIAVTWGDSAGDRRSDEATVGT